MARYDTDSIWLLAATLLLLLLPLGQLALELATSHKRGAQLAPARVAADVALAVLLTSLLGFTWAHGPTLAGVIGLRPGPVDLGGADGAWRGALATWHGLAVASAVVIAGTGGAERARPVASLLVGALLAGVLIPVVAHWTVGGRPEGVPVGWLARWGLVDLGAVTFVHIPAGAAALALATVLGPRRGRFDAHGAPRPPPPGAGVAEVLGGFASITGTLGLVLAARWGWSAELPSAVLVSLLGAAAGVAGAALASQLTGRRPRLACGRLGAMAGIVATSAGAVLGGPLWAALTGLVGGALASLAAHALARRQVDDPVGAAPAHLVAGAWGLLAVTFVVDGPGLPGRLLVQALAAGLVAALSYGLVRAALALLDQQVPLRLSPFSEDQGTDALPAVAMQIPGEERA